MLFARKIKINKAEFYFNQYKKGKKFILSSFFDISILKRFYRLN